MRLLAHVRAALLPLALTASAAAAQQASPYVPNDDPLLPLLEHLILRGDVEDPSPQVRPFRRADAVRVLARADSGVGVDLDERAMALVERLLRHYRDPIADDDHGTLFAEARGGFQSYSQTRRDLLQPGTDGGSAPYAEGQLRLGYDRLAMATRMTAERRLFFDPDWPRAPADTTLMFRVPDAYASAQFGFGSVFLGTVARNWGPVGLPGYGLGDYRYQMGELGFDLGTRTVRLQASLQRLYNNRRTDGTQVQRYLMAHRLGLRVDRRLHVALWESVIASGVDRGWELRFANPFTFITGLNQYGVFDDNTNIMFGADVHWRPTRAVLLEAQLAIDDLTLGRGRCPACPASRIGYTFTAGGPLAARLSWRVLASRTSSLFGRTGDPGDNFSDRSVGIGRPFVDNEQVTLRVGIPLGTVLVQPEVTRFVQGEGRLADPFPARPQDAPVFFLGTPTRTWHVGGSVTGRRGPLDVMAQGGYQRISDAGHVAGASASRWVGRLQVTVGASVARAIR
ncbi:MAG: hypothetical protein NW201_15050 [Gemmatimonadales bacterium]|nr:hypothetical protein [Gemmatimonadales bacterium]